MCVPASLCCLQYNDEAWHDSIKASLVQLRMMPAAGVQEATATLPHKHCPPAPTHWSSWRRSPPRAASVAMHSLLPSANASR